MDTKPQKTITLWCSQHYYGIRNLKSHSSQAARKAMYFLTSVELQCFWKEHYENKTKIVTISGKYSLLVHNFKQFWNLSRTLQRVFILRKNKLLVKNNEKISLNCQSLKKKSPQNVKKKKCPQNQKLSTKFQLDWDTQ